MAHTIRGDDLEVMSANNEDHDSDQVDAVYLNSYFRPHKPVHPHATDKLSTTSNIRQLRWQIHAVVAIFCAGGLLTALCEYGYICDGMMHLR